MNLYTRCFIVFLFTAISYSLTGQTKPLTSGTEINVDLPDETAGTDVVEKGHVQIETGLNYTHFESGTRAFIEQAMIRYGISKNVELRLLAEDGKRRDEYMTETVQSTSVRKQSAT